MRSRNDRPFARYFPELVEAFVSLDCDRFVVDGEILGSDGDFGALLARLHPAASRVAQLRAKSPATFTAFDLVAVDDQDLHAAPFVERRRRLEKLLSDAPPPLTLTPSTTDLELACRWLAETRPGIDGVVAKRADRPYTPGQRTMVKVKREQTLDCVVAGFRWALDRPVVASLLLGVWAEGGLRFVGVASAFTDEFRRQLVDTLTPYITWLQGHPWEHGFNLGPSPTGRLKGSAGRWTPDMELDWVPLRPELICEVAYTQLDVDRLRYPARFLRWRPDL
jgi:ATP-dependent DNA ligase